jgi:hypothetical protein
MKILSILLFTVNELKKNCTTSLEYDLRKEFPERGKDISHVTKFVLQTLRTKKSKFEPKKAFFCANE